MSKDNKNDDEINLAEFEDILSDEDVFESITMIDDDGNEVDFYVIDAIDVDKARYLLIVECSKIDEDEPEALLAKEIAEEGEEFVYETVSDEAEYNKVMLLFQDNDSEYYGFTFRE